MQGGCFSFLKFIVFTINFILWLLGLGVLGVSLWLLFDSDLYLQTSADQQTDYYLSTYILLGVGALVTIMGFLGCCGAWRQSAWMLGTFFAFLLIIFFVEIGLGIMVYFNGISLDEFVKTSVKQTVEHNYNSNNTAAMNTFDLIQEGLACCGTDGPKSWEKSKLIDYDFSGEELGVSTKSFFKLPRSCCKFPESPDCSANLQMTTAQVINNDIMFEAGCVMELTNFLNAHMVYVLAGVASIAVMEILAMLFSLCLCCTVKRIEDRKA